MSIDELLSEKVEAAVRKVLDERFRLLEEQLAKVQIKAVPPPPDPDQRLLLPEAARLAGKNPITLRRAIKKKRLKASKAAGGREWVIRRRDLNEYLAGGGRGDAEVDEDRKIVDAVARMRRHQAG